MFLLQFLIIGKSEYREREIVREKKGNNYGFAFLFYHLNQWSIIIINKPLIFLSFYFLFVLYSLENSDGGCVFSCVRNNKPQSLKVYWVFSIIVDNLKNHTTDMCDEYVECWWGDFWTSRQHTLFILPIMLTKRQIMLFIILIKWALKMIGYLDIMNLIIVIIKVD